MFHVVWPTAPAWNTVSGVGLATVMAGNAGFAT
jgi:hypothetical protein